MMNKELCWLVNKERASGKKPKRKRDQEIREEEIASKLERSLFHLHSVALWPFV